MKLLFLSFFIFYSNIGLAQSLITDYNIGITLNEQAESFVVESINFDFTYSVKQGIIYRKIYKQNPYTKLNFLEAKIKLLKIDGSKEQASMNDAKLVQYRTIDYPEYILYEIPTYQFSNGINKIVLIYKTNQYILDYLKDHQRINLDLLDGNSWIYRENNIPKRILIKNVLVNYVDKIRGEPQQKKVDGILSKKLTLQLKYTKDYFKISLKDKILIKYYKFRYWCFLGLGALFLCIVIFFLRLKSKSAK